MSAQYSFRLIEVSLFFFKSLRHSHKYKGQLHLCHGVFHLYLFSKEVTKPRNKAKEFLFNLVFFLFLPLLLSFKLCKAIVKCCCKKKPASKEETQAKNEDKEEDEIQGPEVEIFKERDILKDGSPPRPSSQVISEQNVTGVKRSHSSDSSRGSLVIKKSKHGSEDEGIMTENRRASTSRRISLANMEDKTPSEDYREAPMRENEPSVVIKKLKFTPSYFNLIAPISLLHLRSF